MTALGVSLADLLAGGQGGDQGQEVVGRGGAVRVGATWGQGWVQGGCPGGDQEVEDE